MNTLNTFFTLLLLKSTLTLKIQGSHQFETKVSKAIEFIKDHDDKNYGYLKKFVRKIKENKISGAALGKETIHLNLKSCPSTVWCAAVLIHETVHFDQYKNHRYDLEDSLKNELEANIVMLNFLKNVNASKTYINHVQKLVDSEIDHSDLNGDGQYDKKDYQKRDW
jgi:hypothetical protein